MDDIEKIENELRAFLGWDSVRWVDDAFVIHCNTYDLRNNIKNITRKLGFGWFVTDLDFSTLPISFLVEMPKLRDEEAMTHQTWTWRGVIHRGHDRPAVVHWTPNNGILTRKWVREGVVTRENGLPPDERLVGFEVVDVDGHDYYADYFMEKWRSGTFKWPDAGPGYPRICQGYNGISIKRRDNNKLHSPDEDLAARSILKIVSRFGTVDGIKHFPCSVFASSFSETYDDGKMLKRSYVISDLMLGEEQEINSISDQLTETDKYNMKKARENMEESPDLYNPIGKFFENDTAEFLWASELM